ncbi:MAG: mechanosensitive ion channel [Candidatus Pacebacteria bacterium]|nr:mechanosensitive ion channel [Candidatus Paceibacterota bacterium]
MENIENYRTYYQQAIEFLFEFGPKLIGAIIILVAGLWLIKQIIKLARRVIRRNHLDPIVESFILKIVAWGLRILLIITVLSQVGIVTTSLAAMIGAVGLAIGLSLQGSLSNFAGGVIIFIFKPFKTGDLIEAQGVTGWVREIKIFQTYIEGVENKIHIVPNGELSNDVITNYSKEGAIRTDTTIGISYDADIKKARTIMMDIMENHEHVLKDPAPSVVVTELADNSVNLRMQPWVYDKHYYPTRFELYEQVKIKFDEAGIGIPYPQRVVHLKKQD